MAGLAEKRKNILNIRKEIETKRKELEKLSAELQRDCTHEVVMDCETERLCYICAFREVWNPGVGFEKLGKPLLVVPEETSKTLVTGQFDELLRKQRAMPDFLKKYFGE